MHWAYRELIKKGNNSVVTCLPNKHHYVSCQHLTSSSFQHKGKRIENKRIQDWDKQYQIQRSMKTPRNKKYIYIYQLIDKKSNKIIGEIEQTSKQSQTTI